MTVSNDLFLAILAMDSYNRVYGAGIELGESGHLGTATIASDELLPANSEAAGFYAKAYSWNGQTVISYRGTTENLVSPWSDGAGSDAWNGYGTAAGSSMNDQAHLAAEFYQAVTGTANGDPRNANVTLTGHSLGGGLAGLADTIRPYFNAVGAA